MFMRISSTIVSRGDPDVAFEPALRPLPSPARVPSKEPE
jgi:hypothetical protein